MRTRSEASEKIHAGQSEPGGTTTAILASHSKRSLRSRPARLANDLRSRAIVPYALTLLLAIGAKLPTLHNSIIFIDEPSYLNEAARLDTPLKFLLSAQYVTETKFPLGLAPYEAALWLNQSRAILWMHVLGLLAVAISNVLLVGLSRRAFRQYVPGVLAALMWDVFLTKNPLTAAPMLEYFQAPLVLGALWLYAGWMNVDAAGERFQRRQWFALAGAGALIGAAALVKPPGLLVAPVLAAGAFFAAGGKAGRRERLYAAVAPLAGATASVGACVLPYLFRPDALCALVFNMVEITRLYSSHQDGLLVRLLGLLLRFDVADVLLVLAAIASHAVLYVKTRGRWSSAEREQNILRLVLLGTGLALLAGYLAGQTKDHYVVAILPPLALYGWSVVTLAYTWIVGARGRVAYTTLWVTLILMGMPRTYPTHYLSLYSSASASGAEYAAELPGVDAHMLAVAIDMRTRPGDSIWVYYNAPEIYWMADRRPATDEPIGTWLVDYYDQFWFQRTVRQLQTERPTLIVGLDSPRYPRARAAPLLDLPLIGAYIQSAYTCTRASPAEVGGSAEVELCSLRAAQR